MSITTTDTALNEVYYDLDKIARACRVDCVDHPGHNPNRTQIYIYIFLMFGKSIKKLILIQPKITITWGSKAVHQKTQC